MGKSKKGYNWRARAQPSDHHTAAQGKAVQVEGVDADKYSGSNALVLPSKKEKLKNGGGAPVPPVGKILSRKQRKRLEKIVDQKKKKENRGQLLQDLATVQTDFSLLSNLESLSAAQTKGVKRQLQEEKETVKLMQTQGTSIHEVQEELKTKHKRRKVERAEKAKMASTDSVLGFDSSSDSSESEEESEAPHPPSELPAQLDNKPTAAVETEVDTTEEDTVAEKDSSRKRDEEDEEEEGLKAAPADSFKPVTTVNVPVNRTKEIEEARSKLPIIGEEQAIVEMINNHQVVILSGETGSGKTTQVPQFLYEAGYATQGKLIGITEPRRVAATAMSSRVGHELGLPTSEVSYQIRFQGNVTEETKIKFMTDGVLLREVEKDFLLSKYSVIILDEAHERSAFTDILIGLLSRIVPLRHKRNCPLKLIIMSATLRVEDFTLNTRLFRTPPPVISVDARQYPVTVHFNKKTADDYLGEAYRKVCKIHRQLPEGGILVFLTGQMEVNSLVKKLRQTFPGTALHNEDDADTTTTATIPSPHKSARGKTAGKPANLAPQPPPDTPLAAHLPEIDLNSYNIEPPDTVECEGHLEDEDEDDLELNELAGENSGGGGLGGEVQPLHVLPLYSLLSQERQDRIFQGPPPGSRLCVVATNIAETSLTIPGVKYVVDCGRVKTKFYDKVTGVTTFVVTWTSQAAANQRAGRAGRQGPGHAYRLYSSAVFNNDMKSFAAPEIQQKPADGLLLQMKAMNIDKVVNFPFPSPPDLLQLRVAEERLQLLGILQSPPPGLPLREVEKLKFTSSVTPLGKAVASFPVTPRFGKILALSHQHNNLLPLAVALVASLTVPEVMVEREVGGDAEGKSGKTPKNLLNLRREWAGRGSTLALGDPMVLLKAICISEKSGDLQEFCGMAGLRPKGLTEIRRLRRQLSAEVEVILPGVGQLFLPGLLAPGEREARLLQQLLLAGCGDQVARRIPEGEEGWSKGAYRAGAMVQPAFIHSASVLKRHNPDWIVYQEVFETDKLYLRCVTQIQPEWLPKYVGSLCTMGKPLEDPEPRYSQETGQVLATFRGTFGPCAWPLPAVEMEHPSSPDKYKLFAKFLLEGRVAPDLAQFTTSLLSAPVILTKTWANLQPRTEVICKTLAGAGVDSGPRLKKIWETEPQFLLAAYRAWLPEVLHPDAAQLWPPSVPLGRP